MRVRTFAPLVLVAVWVAGATVPEIASAATTTSGAVVAPSASTATSAESRMAQEVASHINRERAARGLGALSFDSGASSTAYSVARRNADGGCRSCHSGSVPAGTGEVAYSSGAGGRSGGATVAWMNSSGHRRLLLDTGVTRVAVGVACAADGHFEVIARVWSVSLAQRDDGSPPVTSSGSGSGCGASAPPPPPPPPPPPSPAPGPAPAPSPPPSDWRPAAAPRPAPTTTTTVPLADDARLEALMEALEPTLVQLDATEVAPTTTLPPRPPPPTVAAATTRPGHRGDVTVVLGTLGALVLSPALVLARRRRLR